MFSGTNSRSFVYLACNRNSGKTKGHGFHASCLVEHTATLVSSQPDFIPGDYRCPICRSSESMIHFPEMRIKAHVLGRMDMLENKYRIVEEELSSSHEFR